LSLLLSISDQINHKYREYALYVLQSRGIPNFYDSLTPVQRIILENSPSHFNKTIGLVGEVIRTGLYHHGDSSLSGAISKLARPFGCSYQVLEGDGFFGSPVNPSPSAARYTSVRINSEIKSIVNRHQDLNEKNEEGGHDWLHVEVPVGLLTHVIGIAVGYRSNILPRKLEDIVEYLEGKNKILKPHFRDFTGKIFKFENQENVWLIESGFESNASKRTIRIFDLPPVMRYDSFMEKLINKLSSYGYEFKLNNNSQSKCDVTVWFSKIQPKEFQSVVDLIKKLTQIIVKEDVVLIKDGGVAQFSSVKEYLDAFKIHLETVRLRRIKKDFENLEYDLEFLEAKLKFLIFMSQKKRTNDEITNFLSQFVSWISSKLSHIQIVKLSSDHIVEIEAEIKRIKQLIKETKILIKKQESVVKSLGQIKIKSRSASLMPIGSEPLKINTDIEIFSPEEIDEDNE
jgi:DNA gyrase/topoisomerase IV subunit A